MSPKVSIIMPVYNTAAFLKEAIESILSQTYSNFEFIIINDGSTDSSKLIIESFNDQRIKVINNEDNIGIIATRNKGLAYAKGEYIACMDSDDISLPTRIEKQVTYLDKNLDVLVLATRLMLINKDGKTEGIWKEDYTVTTKEQIKKTLPLINCVGQPTVMMRADIVKKIGYNNLFKNNEDWGLWLTILSEGYTIAKLNEVLVKYRIHTKSTTQTVNKNNIQKKIIFFKYLYLKNKFAKKNFKHTDYKVLFSIFKNFTTLIFPRILIFFTKVRKAHLKKVFNQFFEVRKQLSLIKQPVSNIFFFPFYHTGGAEKVHASILETVKDKRPIIFITGISNGTTFKKEFEKNGTVIDVFYLVNFGPTSRWLQKKIIGLCSQQSETILFGCNSKYFYEIIPYLPKSTKAIDLIHAFVHEYEDGPEKWSLPIVANLSKRVIISYNTKRDFEKLYIKNNIDLHYLDRITFISNFVDQKKYPQKNLAHTLNIIYVGRGSDEKRLHLISHAARLAALEKLPVSFHFIGDVKEFTPAEDLPYCILHGEITDSELMEKHYNNAHILLITSSREGFPMVIMEAMMHGVVPIATNVGGISEHIKSNETGILIETEDENQIVQQILLAIEYFIENKNELEKLSKNTFLYAASNFNKEAFFQSYKKLLN